MANLSVLSKRRESLLSFVRLKGRFGIWRFLALFYLAWTLRVVLLLPIDARMPDPWTRQLWSQGLRLALWVLPVLFYVAYVERAHWASYLRLNSRPRRPFLAACIGLGYLALTTAWAVLLLGADPRSLLDVSGAQWTASLASMSFVSLAEEMLFRGLVFRKLRETQSFLPASLVTSALFVLIHVPGWLYMQGLHTGLVNLAVGIFLISIVLAALVEITRSLWPPVVLHLLNNLIMGALLK